MPVLVASQSLSANWNSKHSLLVNGFHELTDHEWNTLYSLDLFLRPHKLTFQRSGILVSLGLGGSVASAYLCSSFMYSS
jgi:hypothetical protein